MEARRRYSVCWEKKRTISGQSLPVSSKFVCAGFATKLTINKLAVSVVSQVEGSFLKGASMHHLATKPEVF